MKKSLSLFHIWEICDNVASLDNVIYKRYTLSIPRDAILGTQKCMVIGEAFISSIQWMFELQKECVYKAAKNSSYYRFFNSLVTQTNADLAY